MMRKRLHVGDRITIKMRRHPSVRSRFFKSIILGVSECNGAVAYLTKVVYPKSWKGSASMFIKHSEVIGRWSTSR